MAIQVLSDNAPDGVAIALAATDKISLFASVTPVAQRAGAAQAALSTTAATTTTPYGFTTSTQADAVVSLTNELRAALVAFGLITGAA